MLFLESGGASRRLSSLRRALHTPLLVCCWLLSACTGDAPIRVGVVGNFEHPHSTPMRLAAELAGQEINERGGIDGRPLELVFRDDVQNPDTAIRVATELYHADVVAVVGHGSSVPTLAAATIYNGGPNPLVQITPSASSPDVAEAGPYTFQICPTDRAHGAALARWARDTLRLSRGAILYLNTAYGRWVRQAFASEFRSRGGDLAGAFPYLGERPEIGPYLEVLARDPGLEFLVLAGGLADGAAVLQSLRDRGLNLPVLGGEGLGEIEDGGAIAEDRHVTAAYWPTLDLPRNQAFVERYRQMFPDEPPPNGAAAATYDALYLLHDVITRAGPNRRNIRNELAKVGTEASAFEGVLGPIAFDSVGGLIQPEVYVRVVREGPPLAAHLVQP